MPERTGTFLGSLTPARRVRVLDDVTAQLHTAIVSGALQPGERLPNERELSEVFGVGRPTLREALRVLEAFGLVEIRTGKSGGAFVTTPSEESLTRALTTLLAMGEVPLGDLTEFRVSFESENAWWAAQRATDDEIAALRQITSEAMAAARSESTLQAFPEIDARWHGAIARMTKNAVRVCISVGSYYALQRHARALTDPLISSTETTVETLTATANDMARITEAIASRDGRIAQAEMRTHIEDPNRLARM